MRETIYSRLYRGFMQEEGKDGQTLFVTAAINELYKKALTKKLGDADFTGLTSCFFLIPSVRHMINGEPDENHGYLVADMSTGLAKICCDL